MISHQSLSMLLQKLNFTVQFKLLNDWRQIAPLKIKLVYHFKITSGEVQNNTGCAAKIDLYLGQHRQSIETCGI